MQKGSTGVEIAKDGRFMTRRAIHAWVSITFSYFFTIVLTTLSRSIFTAAIIFSKMYTIIFQLNSMHLQCNYSIKLIIGGILKFMTGLINYI
jgi:ABC-type bacteriocin/lantibiotic exporter with double-glycine peptidase domain